MGMVEDAVERGARFALEPRRDGATVSPGILVDVPRTARLWNEEVFGPVLVVKTFRRLEEALQRANDSEFGLQGAVFTASLAAAFRFAEDLEVGSLWVTAATRFRLYWYSFVGRRQGGIGRAGLRPAMES